MKESLTPAELESIKAARQAAGVSVRALGEHLGLSFEEIKETLEGKKAGSATLWLIRNWMAQGQHRMIGNLDEVEKTARQRNENQGAAALGRLGWPQTTQH